MDWLSATAWKYLVLNFLLIWRISTKLASLISSIAVNDSYCDLPVFNGHITYIIAKHITDILSYKA